jgi:ABC-2 type transport system permease protein
MKSDSVLMSTFAVVGTEFFKAFRSGMFKVTVGIAGFVPLMMGILMFIKMHPAAVKSSLMFSKAQAIPGPADWYGFFGLFAQIISGVGLLVIGFAASWMWGREFSDRTVKDLLALPFPRELIVIGKLLVLCLWGICLFVVSSVVMLLIGLLIHLPSWNTSFAVHCFGIFSIATIMNIAVSTVTAYIASVTRNYIAPIGFAIAALMMGNFVGMLGLAAYYPWGVSMTFSMSATEHTSVEVYSFVILAITSIAGLVATMYWWRHADQT